MIGFFRRALKSWIVLGLFGLIMIAFIVTGIGTPTGLDPVGGVSGDTMARVGKERLNANDVAQRIQLAQQNLAQSQPGLTLPDFVAQGGADQVFSQMVEARALDAWAGEHRIVAGKRLVDGEIASIAAFRGPTGTFDEASFRAALAQRGVSEAQLRADIATDIIRRQLLAPAGAGVRAPSGLAMPYAELLLELRKGEIAAVPAALLAKGLAPNDAELQRWYAGKQARYALPERRVIRYASIGAEQLGAAAKASEAEIAAAYKAEAAKYGASETRSFSQVILPGEPAAKALYAKIKAGTPFADAAKSAGFAPADTALGVQTRAQLTTLAGAALAAQAFAATEGATLAPAKSPLGWHVVRVDSVKTTAATPLAAVRPQLVAQIEARKAEAALADLLAAIEDEIADGASFDEVVKARGLKANATPPLSAQGLVDGLGAPTTDPVAMMLLKTAFEATSDEDPTVETLAGGQAHVLFKVGQVLPSTPRPLAQVRARVLADFVAERSAERARSIAAAIEAKADRGVPLARAVAEAGAGLPPPQATGVRQIDLARAPQQAVPAIAALFRMKPGEARVVPSPREGLWYVVRLDSTTKGNIADAPELVALTRNELSGQLAQEIVQQLSAAAAKSVGVERNAAAFARLKTQLRGGGQ